MVLWLAERLLAEGKRVGVLTRGYRGVSVQAPSLQAVEALAVQETPMIVSSDEVWVYRKRLETGRKQKRLLLGVGADRWAWGQTLEQAGAEWFLLDDGFQHLQLARDLDIVMIDALDPFGGGALLPAGRLREPHSALARADIVVISRSQHAPAVETIVRRHTAAPIFYAKTALTEMPQWNPSQVGPMKPEPQKRKFYAFCGLGNPQGFFEDLRRWKIQVAAARAFPDHHAYTPQDVEAIQLAAQAAGADALVCTEKDVANLLQLRFARLPLFYCRIVLHVSDSTGFWRQAHEIIGRRRGEARA
jgi:tetraacyldisaccharide 4'-kinase